MAAAPLKCRRCLREVPADARFCPICGAHVAGAPRVLRRCRDAGKLAGVCAGMADYFDLDPTLMRVIFLVATFFTGVIPGIILYLILALILPAD